MNITSIINKLERIYYIGFTGKSSEDGFTLNLSESDDDKFEINVRVIPQTRLSVTVKIEKYGASFLHLLNRSDTNKRQNFIDYAKGNDRGEILVYINKNKVTLENFVDDKSEWNDFKIQFHEIPFEENEDEIVRILTFLVGMMFTLFDYSIEGYEEGNKEDIHISKYERNPVNRQICLAYKGYKCSCCGFDFEKTYGEIGKNTIEVHHIKLVSKMDNNYIDKPLEDLVPVCSNCHTIIHKREIPYSIEEIQEMLKRNNNKV